MAMMTESELEKAAALALAVTGPDLGIELDAEQTRLLARALCHVMDQTENLIAECKRPDEVIIWGLRTRRCLERMIAWFEPALGDAPAPMVRAGLRWAKAVAARNEAEATAAWDDLQVMIESRHESQPG